MSFIARFLRHFMKSARYVGQDLEGNRFYEATRLLNDSRRTRRTVEYKNPDGMWNYIGGTKRLPVQWSSWLAHTRPTPPTLDELRADLARQQRVLVHVAMLEARDKEEKFHIQATPSVDEAINSQDLQHSLAEKLSKSRP